MFKELSGREKKKKNLKKKEGKRKGAVDFRVVPDDELTL